MATRFTRSQTRTIGPNPALSLRYNPLSTFGSNRQGAEIVNQFLSFSAHRATPSISQNRLPPESPTPATHIIILLDNYKSPESKDHPFGRPTAFNGGGGGPRFPGNGPPGLPWMTTTPTSLTMTSSPQTLTQTKNYQQSRSPRIRLPSWRVPSIISLATLVAPPLTLPPALKSENPISLMGPIPESSGLS